MPIKTKIIFVSLGYVVPFFMSWISFIKGIVVLHPEFVEEYGWLAYQPFTFFVLVVTFLSAKACKLGLKVVNKEITDSEANIQCCVLVIKVIVVVSLVTLFYVNVLGHKPNLLICL